MSRPASGVWALLLAGVLASLPVGAMVVLNATRLVFGSEHPEALIMAQNHGNQAVLLQAWLAPAALDDEAPAAAASLVGALPFALTPPLSVVEAEGRQTLRVFYQGVGLPGDRESLLYLYVLAVPRASEDPNVLQIAVRQRINLFYRPPGLPGDAADSARELCWQFGTNEQGRPALFVRNPGSYYLAMLNLQLLGLGGAPNVPLGDSLLLAPGAEQMLVVPADAALRFKTLSFTALSDYGGEYRYRAPLAAAQVFHGAPL